MLNNLPAYIALLFGATTLAVLYIFFSAVKSKVSLVLIIISGWLILQAILAVNGFYTAIRSMPQKMVLVVFPPLATIFILLLTPGGKKFTDHLSAEKLTWLHTSRIAVEIILYLLFVHKAIPQLMTFEGRNFDIIAGITAPVIAWFGFKKQILSKSILIGWNIICLLLVLNITINAVLSLPAPFQQFAFDQPNIAVLYFPFVWLPAFVVPVVIFSHIAVIRQLVSKNSR